jgi:hypothetical protein
VLVTSQAAQAVDFTIGAGAAPDYEGSADYEAVPFWTCARAISIIPRPMFRCNLERKPQIEAMRNLTASPGRQTLASCGRSTHDRFSGAGKRVTPVNLRRREMPVLS